MIKSKIEDFKKDLAHVVFSLLFTRISRKPKSYMAKKNWGWLWFRTDIDGNFHSVGITRNVWTGLRKVGKYGEMYSSHGVTINRYGHATQITHPHNPERHPRWMQTAGSKTIGVGAAIILARWVRRHTAFAKDLPRKCDYAIKSMRTHSYERISYETMSKYLDYIDKAVVATAYDEYDYYSLTVTVWLRSKPVATEHGDIMMPTSEAMALYDASQTEVAVFGDQAFGELFSRHTTCLDGSMHFATSFAHNDPCPEFRNRLVEALSIYPCKWMIEKKYGNDPSDFRYYLYVGSPEAATMIKVCL